MFSPLLPPYLKRAKKRAKKILLNALLKPITDTKTKQRHELRCWVWVVIWGIIVAVVIVGGRFLFFEVGDNPFQLPMKARDWTGFGESYDTNVSEVAEKGTETDGKITKKIDKITTTQKTLQPAKTLWDWMGLLLAPATLAALGFLFQSSQERAKRDKEEADKKRDADQQKADKKRDSDQQREQALQAYFDQLSALLVDKRLLRNLRDKVSDKEEESTNSEAQPSSNNPASKIDVKDPEIDAEAALDVVKAKTLALFRLFDNADPPDMPRKALVLTFLGDTGLLNEDVCLGLDLSRSDWKNADLSTADFSNANLYKANFRLANLSSANLINADLRSANLINADLSRADLSHANLSRADLSGADLSRASLRIVNLEGADLSGADLSHAYLINADFFFADLSGADLSHANLDGANLRSADLSSADLSSANLFFTDLSSAYLINADLSSADLKHADLSSTILLRADLTQTKNLTQQRLEGENPPLLCNVKLPYGINVDPYRDCEKLPEVLLERYPDQFKTLGEAQDYVDSFSKH